MRQDRQPLAQQRVDLLGPEPITDGLQRGRVLDRGEPIVEGFEGDAGLGGVAFGPLVAIDVQLSVVGKYEQNLMNNGPKSSSTPRA
jgi:hypothetical protein